MPAQPTRIRRMFALVVALLLLAAACADSTGSSDARDSGFAPADTNDTSADGANAGDAGDSGDSGDAAPAPADEAPVGSGDSASGDTNRISIDAVPLFLGRDIIKTADVVIEADDVAATTRSVVDTVFASGGAVWGQESRTEPDPRTVLTIRVRPEDFDALIDAIVNVPGVGVVSNESRSDDVTDAVIDLDARITAAQSSVERVQALLDEARDIDTVFRLEEELATRQADLERLLGQRKTLGDRIALSTITLTIVQRDPDRLAASMDVVAWLGTDEADACPGVTNLSIGADGDAVVCVNVSNTGDDELTDVKIEIPLLRLRVNDFEPVGSDVGFDSIPAGAELLAIARLDATDGFVNRVDVSNGRDIEVTVVAHPATTPDVDLAGTDTVYLSADVDDPLPGFGDAFSSGWGAMTTVLSLLLIAVGALLPFSPFLVLLVWWWRRAARRRAEYHAQLDPPPAPPAPTP